jgi:hypothetical protein
VPSPAVLRFSTTYPALVRLVALAALLALTAGLLTWGVVTDEPMCRWAFARKNLSGPDHITGYLKVPCGLVGDALSEYIKQHLDDVVPVRD